MHPHEEAFIERFVHRHYRDRYIAKGGILREHYWHELQARLDPRCVLELPSNLHLLDRILPVFRAIAPSELATCLSAIEELHEREVTFQELEDWEATVLSFRAGELAYYQSEFCMTTYRCLLIESEPVRRRARSILESLSREQKEKDRPRRSRR